MTTTETADLTMFATRWARHAPTCKGTAKCSGCIDGERRRQRAIYAHRVMLNMTGGKSECPCCARPFAWGTFEVDRIGGQEEGYVPGAVALICQQCNRERGERQAAGRDWPNVDAYRAAVRAASVGVEIPSTTEASRLWRRRDMGSAEYVNKYA